MRIPIYQVDAFTSELFHGNPAAVCRVGTWPKDELLQAIAAENNLSETGFFAREGDGFRLRWFTPKVEVDLCGHATLATAWVILERLEPRRNEVRFHTRSGLLTVRRAGSDLEMDFPATPAAPCDPPAALVEAMGGKPLEAHAGPQYVLIYEDEAAVRALAPDMAALMNVDRHAVIATARGAGDVDFVSRFFAPKFGVPEDPVTGSAHCTLVPLWAAKLGKTTLRARQVSARGGELTCTMSGDRVLLGGRCVPFLDGAILIPEHAK